jgi:hypothetical protein
MRALPSKRHARRATNAKCPSSPGMGGFTTNRWQVLCKTEHARISQGAEAPPLHRISYALGPTGTSELRPSSKNLLPSQSKGVQYD